MKKAKRKALLKSVRKAVRENIRQNLIAKLKEVAEKISPANKKFEKEIEKSSRQLAKKLSKEIKISKAALIEISGNAEAAVLAPADSVQQPDHSAPVKTVPANQSRVLKPKKALTEKV